MENISAVIIDDEKGSRETLRNLLKLYCRNISLLGESETIQSALHLILINKPDIVFLDIEMPGGNAFDLISKLKDVESKIIFTTAHSKYAIKAIKVSAYDYLLKPIDIDELKESIRKVKNAQQKNVLGNLLLKKKLVTNDEYLNRIAIPNSRGYDIINTKDIFLCEGNRNYTTFYLINDKIFTACKTLKEYERILFAYPFVRVHQKFLVNFDFVEKYIKGKGGELVLANGRHISVSQNKKVIIKNILSKFKTGKLTYSVKLPNESVNMLD